MLPDGAVNGFGAVGQDVKKKKRRNKKTGGGGGNNAGGSNGATGMHVYMTFAIMRQSGFGWCFSPSGLSDGRLNVELPSLALKKIDACMVFLILQKTEWTGPTETQMEMPPASECL
jgi:hypothetical protein